MDRNFNAMMDFDLDSSEFASRLAATDDAVLLDVRTPAEFEQARIPGATNIDIAGPSFPDLIEELDRKKAYFVYCRSGNRSTTACRFMSQLGFDRVYNLANGIIDWDGEVE
jgi:rhodanese-related sulfurtransferase